MNRALQLDQYYCVIKNRVIAGLDPAIQLFCEEDGPAGQARG
jgi:hypothetical protein